jgi:hypothetical protein
VLPAIANGRNSQVEVENIFGETQILVFLHALGHERTLSGSKSQPVQGPVPANEPVTERQR